MIQLASVSEDTDDIISHFHSLACFSVPFSYISYSVIRVSSDATLRLSACTSPLKYDTHLSFDRISHCHFSQYEMCPCLYPHYRYCCDSISFCIPLVSTFFSPFATVSLCGQRVLHRPFHLSRSVAHSSLMSQAVRSLLTINFGLPLWRFPSSSFRQLLGCFRFNIFFNVPKSFQSSHCHNHRYQFLPFFVQDILMFPVFLVMYTPNRCSNKVTRITHCTILISAVAIRVSSLTDIGHLSQPLSNIGRIAVWYINFDGTFLSQIAPLSYLHFDHTFANLLSMSLLAPLLLLIVDRRYLKDWTIGKLRSSVSMYLFFLFVACICSVFALLTLSPFFSIKYLNLSSRRECMENNVLKVSRSKPNT